MVIVDCIVLHYMHIWHLRIRASNLQFRESKINMALARMDKLVKKLMSNPAYDYDHDHNGPFYILKKKPHKITSRIKYMVIIYTNVYIIEKINNQSV